MDIINTNNKHDQINEAEKKLKTLLETKTHLEKLIGCQTKKEAKKWSKEIDNINEIINQIKKQNKDYLNQTKSFGRGYMREASTSCQPSSSNDENTSLLNAQSINSINNSQQPNEENKCCPSSCTIL